MLQNARPILNRNENEQKPFADGHFCYVFSSPTPAIDGICRDPSLANVNMSISGVPALSFLELLL